MVGRVDVDAMCDKMSSRQFDEWNAFRRIEPDVANRLDRLCVILRTGLLALCHVQGIELTPEDLDPAMEKATGNYLGPAQTEAAIRAAYGR